MSTILFAGYTCKADALFKEQQVRGCEHYMSDYSARFCPKCGKPAWVGRDVPIDGYDPRKEKYKTFEVYCTEGQYYVGRQLGYVSFDSPSAFVSRDAMQLATAVCTDLMADPLVSDDELSRVGIWLVVVSGD